MNVPVATSVVRSASASVSAAGGGGKTNGKMKNPSATPKAVPNRPPTKKMMKPRQNLRMGNASAIEPSMLRNTRGLPQMLRSSIRAGQPANGEFDAIARQHAPALDLGLVGGLGKAA